MISVILGYNNHLINNLIILAMANVKGIPSKLRRPGFDYYSDPVNSSRKAHRKTLEYNDSNHEVEVNAFGYPITTRLARKLIKNYWDTLNRVTDGDKGIAFSFGKEAMLSILSQKGCEGIRFYFAYKRSEDFVDPINEGVTLVAIGANALNKDVDLNEDYIASNLTSDVVEDSQVWEMVPPLKLSECLVLGMPLIQKNPLAKIISDYFTSH